MGVRACRHVTACMKYRKALGGWVGKAKQAQKGGYREEG